MLLLFICRDGSREAKDGPDTGARCWAGWFQGLQQGDKAGIEALKGNRGPKS